MIQNLVFKMKFKRIVALLMMVLVLITLISGCANKGNTTEPANKENVSTPTGKIDASKVFKWKIQAADVSGTPRYELIKYFTKAVEEASGGRLVIELYAADTLYPTFNAVDAVKNKVTEAAITWGDYSAGKEPMLKLLTYRPSDPFNTLIEADYLLRKTEGLIGEAYKKLGVTYAGSVIAVPGETFQSKKPLKTLGDYKGAKIRSSGLGQELFQKLGAAVVTMPMTDVYNALKLNTIDAFESGGYADNWQSGFQEVIKYNIEPPLHAPSALMGGHLIVNNQVWESLPDDLKAIVKYCAESSRLYMWTELKAKDEEARLKFAEKGIETITLPEQDVQAARKAGAELLREYRSKSELCNKYIDAYHDVLVQLGYSDIAKILE
ncbi:MAG TPA: TRAP transporter substrate-binding protein DctP [Thermoanaerobacterales bacterium]|nr:TRAP transporter substrate-binding protein DctP [Thermoanaerobacterales bacterium]